MRLLVQPADFEGETKSNGIIALDLSDFYHQCVFNPKYKMPSAVAQPVLA